MQVNMGYNITLFCDVKVATIMLKVDSRGPLGSIGTLVDANQRIIIRLAS